MKAELVPVPVAHDLEARLDDVRAKRSERGDAIGVRRVDALARAARDDPHREERAHEPEEVAGAVLPDRLRARRTAHGRADDPAGRGHVGELDRRRESDVEPAALHEVAELLRAELARPLPGGVAPRAVPRDHVLR